MRAAPSVLTEDAGVGGDERSVVFGLDVPDSKADKDEDDGYFDDDDDRIDAGRFLDAADEEHGDHADDEDGGQVDHAVDDLAAGQGDGLPGACDEFDGKVDAEIVAQADDIGGPAYGYRCGSHCVFEHQVPADDPGDELADGGIGVGVGAAGDGNHRGELQ